MHRALILAALWTVPITVGTASAAMAAPAAGPTGAKGSGTDVVIRTGDDLELAGTYFEPRKKKDSRMPGVLLVHDAGGNRLQMVEIAEKLNKKGFGVLTLDLRGHGESKTDQLDWDRCDADGRSRLWQQAPRDVEAGADWLLSQRDVHSTSLSLVGYRAGCALAARHAERDENVVGMALLSPKSQELGFDVEGTIRDVNGLPTFVVDQSNDETKRMVSEANLMGPSEYISLVIVPTKGPTVLDDSKTATRVTSWLADTALPRKGRG